MDESEVLHNSAGLGCACFSRSEARRIAKDEVATADDDRSRKRSRRRRPRGGSMSAGAQFLGEPLFKPGIVNGAVELDLHHNGSIMELLVLRGKDFAESPAARFAHDQAAVVQYDSGLDDGLRSAGSKVNGLGEIEKRSTC
jgi:hypothetical protein